MVMPLIIFLLCLHVLFSGGVSTLNRVSSSKVKLKEKGAPADAKLKCPKNSFCFLNKSFCYPGYTGNLCTERLVVANPWYTKHCPNLNGGTQTFLGETPLTLLGGEYSLFNASESLRDTSMVEKYCGGFLKACAYLCYAHPEYGTAVVPQALWKQAQIAEAALWASIGHVPNPATANDRAQEHWEAYQNFQILVSEKRLFLGRVVEVGAGPWTQLKGMLHVRPELVVQDFTVWEPSASSYMSTVSSCSYSTGKLNTWTDSFEYHSFPVHIESRGGESLAYHVKTSPELSVGRSANSSRKLFDTVISINVLEHTQDAFKYLTGLYVVLKRGGLLIWHERYYDDQSILLGDRFHPIRVKKIVLDHFLSKFDVIFNNVSASYGNRPNEKGYYVLAIKR